MKLPALQPGAYRLRYETLDDAGNKVEAQKILARLEEQGKGGDIAPYAMALVCLGLGDKERAIDELERGFREGETNYLFVIKVDPLLDDLRGNPRFEALVQKVLSPKAQSKQ